MTTAFHQSAGTVNRKPERVAGGLGQLQALAKVITRAKEAGMRLSDEDIRSLQLNMLAENRPDYGVRPLKLHYGTEYSNEKTGKDDKRLYQWDPSRDLSMAEALMPDGVATYERGRDHRAMGYYPSNSKNIHNLEITPNNPRITKMNRLGDPVRWEPLDPQAAEENAAAYIFRAMKKAQEQKLDPTAQEGTLEKLMRSGRWNGQGQVKDHQGKVVADADNHAAKLQRMQIPQNESILNFMDFIQRHPEDAYWDARDYRK